MVQSGCVNGSFAAASVDAKVVCRGGGLAPRERPAESDSIAALVLSSRRGAPFGNEFWGASSGRTLGEPIVPMVRLRPLFLTGYNIA